MAKKYHKRKEKNYIINLPLYIIPLKREDKGLFGALDAVQMVQNLKVQLEEFPLTELPSRGKSKRTHITSLHPEIIDMDGTQSLLVRASVFDSNLDDTYLNDGSTQSKIAKTSKVGGKNYYILFYPRIEGQNSDKYIYSWLQVVYEDPIHTTGIATSVAKKISQQLIEKEPFNVKLQSAIDDFKTIAICPEVQVRMASVYHIHESEYPQYQQYLVNAKVTEGRLYTFSNMPENEVEKLLKDKSDHGEVTILKKAIFGKKEYHVKRERFDEAKEWKESADLIFNTKKVVTQEEIDKGIIFEDDYIKLVFKSVIENYLLNQKI